jgi:3-oxoacyl-(acyl-carrier-protein) synthase
VVERVVVTGLGVLAPNGNGTAAFARALREGKSGVRSLPHLRHLGLVCQVGGVPEGIEQLRPQYLTDEAAAKMSSNMELAAIAAIDAWNDGGLERPPADSREVDWDSGAIIGTGCGSVDIVGKKLVPFTPTGKMGNMVDLTLDQAMISGNSACVSGLLALGNRVSTNSSACSTGNEAVVQAFVHIREGRAKRMLAGGSEGHSGYSWAGADSMKVLSRLFNDAPEKASRPLSATAGGFVPASGAGILLLESLSTARARGARIYAEVLAGEVNCGGQRMGGSMSAPNPEGVRRCIRAAVAMADIDPEEIDAINGHLTATFADPHEVENWSVALGISPSKMPLIHATKSLIGHALGAAGGIECVASVLELDQGFVHGSLNCEDLHPALTAYADRIPQTTVLVPGMKIMAKASFGFGDVNACIVFRKFEN